MIDSFSQLDKQQKSAVTFPNNAMVVAGPGSGKTEVLAWKVGYLLKFVIKPPFRVAAITFTREAAGELRRRVQRIAADDADRATCTTIHSFCLQVILRPYVHLIGSGLRSGFEVIESKEQGEIAADLIRKHALPTQPRDFMNAVRSLKSKLQYPDPGKTYTKFSREHLCLLYQEQLVKANIVDFDDLVWYAYWIVAKVPAAKQVIQTSYPWFVIDEYQDTDIAQHILLAELQGPAIRFFAVGDPDQSIYRFRHTDPENLNRFVKDYQATRFDLGANYRSPKVIAEAASRLISQNDGKARPAMRLLGKGGDSTIYVHECANSDDEASFVVNTVLKKALSKGITLPEFAVFGRNRDHLASLITELKKQSIKYHFVDDLPYEETVETRIVSGAVRFLAGDGSFDALGDALDALNVLYPDNRLGFEAEKNAVTRNSKVISLLQAARAAGMRPEAALSRLLRQFPLTDRIAKIELSSRDRKRRYMQLDAITSWVEKCDKAAKCDSSAFLMQFGIQDAIRLMTLHGAKGLEFPVVVMMALEEGSLPFYYAIKEGTDQAIADERRAMYVGLTRARQVLVITYAQERYVSKLGRSLKCEPSRFIGEIPADLVKRI